MNVPDYLGQNLFRQALQDKNLEPFAIAAQHMHNLEIPIRYRADVFKAIRFGLAGLAIHGWQERVTEPLEEPFEFGGKTIGYRFSPSLLPTDILPESAACAEPEYDQTAGWRSLLRFEKQSELSMHGFIDDPTAEIRGIPIGDIESALFEHVLEARRLRLDQVPNMFNNSTPLRFDIYKDYGTYNPEGIRLGLGGSTRTTVMATINGIAASMRRSLQESEANCSPTSFDRHASMMEVVRHAVRASQRQDGLHMVVDYHDIYPSYTWGSAANENELMWANKHQLPPRRIVDGEEPQDIAIHDVFQSYLRRQKCPAGYKPEATDVMPVVKLSDSLITYIIESGLDDPQLYASKEP